MSGSRRTHSKSRNGCLQCKKWRKKCDQQFPVCGACLKRGVNCSYNDPEFQFNLSDLTVSKSNSLSSVNRRRPVSHRQLDLASNPSTTHRLAPGSSNIPSQAQSSAGISPLPSVSFSIPGLRSKDIGLLHHYLHSTAFSITMNPAHLSDWRCNIPELAKGHRYLLHNLLAFAAAHNSYLRPNSEEEYQRLTAYHQAKSAELFVKEVSNVTTMNASAICSSAGFTILTELTLPKYSSEPKGSGSSYDALDGMLDLFDLTRKIVPLWRDYLRYNVDFPYLQEMIEVDRARLDIDRMREVASAIMDIGKLLESMDLVPDQKENYKQAIRLLSFWDSSLADKDNQDPRGIQRSLRVGGLVDDSFIKYVRQRDPMALLIIAQFCVLTYHATIRWCLEDWAKNIFVVIEKTIGEREPWGKHMRRAAEMMRQEPALRIPQWMQSGEQPMPNEGEGKHSAGGNSQYMKLFPTAMKVFKWPDFPNT